MGGVLRILTQPIIKPLLKPLVRLLVGLIAVPVFRLLLRRVVRLQELDQELEKDLEEWFRGSLLLLVATRNMEETLFGWVPLGAGDQFDWLLMAGRLLLAIGVIEAMPDQELFAIVHPGPPKPKYDRKKGFRRCCREQCWPIIRGILCQHLNRSSPVLAIMCAILPGTVGWVCFFLAIIQYLIIGLITSRDKARDVLGEFDRRVAERRRELVEEFDIDEQVKAGATAGISESPAKQSSAGVTVQGPMPRSHQGAASPAATAAAGESSAAEADTKRDHPPSRRTAFTAIDLLDNLR